MEHQDAVNEDFVIESICAHACWSLFVKIWMDFPGPGIYQIRSKLPHASITDFGACASQPLIDRT